MGHNSPVVEHSCIEALEAKHCCTEVVAAELEKGPHLLEVLKPQGLSVGSVAEKVERAFENFEQGENRCSL